MMIDPNGEVVTEEGYVYTPDDALLCTDCFRMITGEKIAKNSFVKIGKNPPCGTCGGVMVLTTVQQVKEAIESKD